MKASALLTITIGFLLLFYAELSFADDFNFELSANRTALDSEFEAVIELTNSKFIAGTGGLYNNDDYRMLFAKALIANEIFIDGLTGGLGFKGAWGDAEKRHTDGNILNLGFACYAMYDLSKSELNNFPVTLAASCSISPEPLSFDDTEEFIEVLAEASWKVLEKAALTLRYRYIEIDFDNQTKWKKSDSAGYIGLKFFF